MSSLTHLTDQQYFGALRTVDDFLNAWLNLDPKNGIALLTQNAKRSKTPDELQRYFSGKQPAHEAYEIVGFKKIDANMFEFHVWMYGYAMGLYGPGEWSRPPGEIIRVVKEDNRWYVENLPKY